MRILFVLHTFPPESWGGTELHVQGIAGVLADNGHEVRIFCREGDPTRPHGTIRQELQDGLLVTRYNNLYEDYESFESTWRHEGSHRAFEKELEAFQPDVVHVHHLTGLSITILEAVKRKGLGLIFSLHDFWTVCPRGQRLHPDGDICETMDRRRCHACLAALWPGWFDELPPEAESSPVLEPWDDAMRRHLGLCDVLLTPSSFHRDRMIEATGLDPRRFVALAHGLDHDMFPPPKDATPRPRVIGYIGSVIPTKGVHILIEAFNRLEGNFELEIWGHAPKWHEKKDYLGELKNLVRDPERVRFMGHYDNAAVPGILSRMDILVVPSLWWETFSLTIREAMLAGVPVVAADLGAMREAIARTEAGLVFEATSPGALARSIMRLVEDRKLRLKCAGQRLQVKTLQQNAADYVKIYQQAIQIAEQSRNLIEVSESSFPKKKSPQEAASGPRDLRVSIEKIGDGDVTVQSAVKRGQKTQVSFVLDYGPADADTEVHLTVDFGHPKTEADSPPAAEAAPEELPEIPREAGSSLASAAASQGEDAQKKALEESMYKKDQEIFPKQVEALDAMVNVTHLDEKDQDMGKREERPRRRERDSQRTRSRRDERRPRRDDRDRPRRDDGEGERRPSTSRQRRPEDSERRPRRSRPRRDEGEARRERREKRDEPRRPQRSGESRKEPAKPKSPQEKPRQPRPEESDVVWGGESTWALPESSAPAPRSKPERAPHHRTGRQPNVKPRDGGAGFGDGV